ncbi:MAG TPA: BON domain-containing protein [Vicinamibacterales bacterium]|nr:BON domain-containing protein [Vicinamibacterales bacterium]
MKTRSLGAILIVAIVIGARTMPATAKAPAPKSTIEEIRHELLQLPYYGVFDFISFKYDKGTVTLMGYAYRPSLKSDAERAVRRVAGVDTVDDQIEELPRR